MERCGLARPVGPNKSENAALFDTQIDTVHRDRCSECLPETTCFYAWHGFSAPLCVSSPRRFLTVRHLMMTCVLRQHLVLPVSSRAAEWLRGPGAILRQETSAVRPAATDCVRPY